MTARLIALAVILFLSGRAACAAQCDGGGPELKEPALCSKLFEFSGRCGVANYPQWTPDVVFVVDLWEKAPIRIFAISGDAIVRATWRAVIAKMFLGNSFNADPMTPYVNASGGALDLSGRVAVPIHVEQRFKIGMQLEAKGSDPLTPPHLDVHLTCEPQGASFFGSLSVWYEVSEPLSRSHHEVDTH